MALDPDNARSLRHLLETRPVAALATLHGGDPAVSMVPYALLPRGGGFVIHVSRLASHTGDMLAEPRVSLLISAGEQPGASPLALPRITLLGTARPLAHDAPEYPAARQAYQARFPDAAAMFNLGDFSLFLIVPSEARWIAGFAQARTLTPAALARVLQGGEE